MKRHTFVLSAALAAMMSTGVFAADQHQYPNLLEKLDKSGNFAPLFPFQPTHAAPLNITNVRTWPGVSSTVAGQEGFIQAKGSHFVDGSGAMRRFLGTNICFSGCFPEHEEAERVAAELARYGINAMRLHYVHHVMPKDGAYPEKDSFLEPVQLEKFDYLFNQLKQHGIYCYFQLNIGRKFGTHNGFENAEKLPWYNNGIDNVDARMIELHKKYVSDILNHVNPYTHLAYKDDPAISQLEIANENSIVFAWFAPKYDFSHLVEPYATDMQHRWNDWLKAKYGTMETLRKSWLAKQEGDGQEMMPEGIMKSDIKTDSRWGLQQDKLSVSDWEICPATAEDKIAGTKFARLHVQRIGATANMPQFYRNSLAFTQGRAYTLTLKMRVDKPAPVSVRFSQDHNPWRRAGLAAQVNVTTAWQSFTFPFTANCTDEAIRLVISNFTPGVIDIADVSLVTGTNIDCLANVSMEKQTIPWPQPEEWSLPMQRALDFTDFLGSLEAHYFRTLREHLKNTVKPHQPVTGTQIYYGFTLPQAEMDYCDNHRYWNHPVFPGTVWNSRNWYLLNTSLVNAPVEMGNVPGHTMTRLSRERVFGRPLTVSEYDHPNANMYAAEGNLMLAATAAFQDWGGIYQFAWSHSRDFFRSQMAPMFDMCSASQKLVHFPACYAMFVRGDVAAGSTDCVYVMDSNHDAERMKIAMRRGAGAVNEASDEALRIVPLLMVSGKRVAELPELFPCADKKLVKTWNDVPMELKNAIGQKQIHNSTGELMWNWQQPDAGFFQVDTANTKVFSGFVRNRAFRFKGLTLKPAASRLDWLTLSLTNTCPANKAAQQDIMSPGRYLLAVTGLCHNTDAVIVDIDGNHRISPAKDKGGTFGKAPILCEGIESTLTFANRAGQVECYALDENGDRKAEVPTETAGGDCQLTVHPKYQTVWYEVVIR